MNSKYVNFSLCKKLFSHRNHDQLQNEYVWYIFAFYQILIVKINQWQYNKLKRRRKNHFIQEFLYAIIAHVTLFLKKISLSRSFCSLRSGFHKATYDTFKFFLVLSFLEALTIIALVKQFVLFRKCFKGPLASFNFTLLCSFHPNSTLHLVSPM